MSLDRAWEWLATFLEYLEPALKFLAGASHWIFPAVVIAVLFWPRKREGAADEKAIMPVTVGPERSAVLPDGSRKSVEGSTVVWTLRPSWRLAIGTFAVGSFILAILLTIDLERSPNLFSYDMLCTVFPPLQSPLDPAAYVIVFFHSWPLVCFALTIWCIGGETSIRVSTNCLERRHKWFRWSGSKLFRDGMIVVDATSNDIKSPREHVWKWSVEVHSGRRWEVLFLDSSQHTFLKLETPEGLAAEIASITGWPATTRIRFADRVQTSSD